MRLYQHRDYYYVYHKGIRKSLKTKNKDVADELYRKLELEYLEQDVSMDLWPKAAPPHEKYEVFSTFKPNTRMETIKEKMGKKYGYVYVVSNPALIANYKKIGATQASEPEERINALSQCISIPHPFKLECLYIVDDCYQFEVAVHKILKKFRVSKHKEFFNVPYHVARHLIKEKTGVFEVPDGSNWIEQVFSYMADEIMENGEWEPCEEPEEFEI
jgi:hypothetical protein